MQDEDTESLLYLGVGPLAAILLGMALVPLRSYTTASNFTFAFMALTILVAELGGRRPAVATALCSALSLDFFLTQPYLRLTIADKHDLIAFIGLAVCGLMAATFGSQRGQRAAALRTARGQLDLLHAAVEGLASMDSLASRLGKILDAARSSCPIAAAVVRDEHDSILAASQGSQATTVPVQMLSPQTLLPLGSSAHDVSLEDIPFPTEGARLALVAGNRALGWLDLWGDGSPASARSRRALSDVARLLALQLAGIGRSPARSE